MRNIYGVFYINHDSHSDWFMTHNKRGAVRFAKAHNGRVGVVQDAPERRSYDAPTFQALMTPVADFRLPRVVRCSCGCQDA